VRQVLRAGPVAPELLEQELARAVLAEQGLEPLAVLQEQAALEQAALEQAALERVVVPALVAAEQQAVEEAELAEPPNRDLNMRGPICRSFRRDST
jgi:hypothetical protein